MSYAAVEEKLRNLPEDCLDEIAAYIDFLLFRRKQAMNLDKSGDLSKYFGSIKTLGDGMEVQRQMRDEWN